MLHVLQSRTYASVLFSTAVAGSIAMSPAIYAADSTWLNSGTDFNDDGNWTDGVPGSGDDAIFTGPAATNPNLSASLSIEQINFSTADASGYELSSSPGQSLTLTGSTAISSGNTSGTNTVSASLVLDGNTLFNQAPGGELVVSGDIGEVGGAAKLTLFRTSAGLRTFTLSGDNSYSGGTDLAGVDGTLNIGSATALGTGALTNATSTYTVDNTSGSDLTLTNALNLNGTNTIFTGSSSLEMTGAVGLGGFSGDRTITVSNNTLHLTGNITEDANSRAITKNGAGTLILDGSSNHSGGTTVSAGTLIINGDWTAATANVSVNDDGTLGGTGVVGGDAAVNEGGTLTTGQGALSFANDLTFDNASMLVFAAGDAVAVDGMLTLTDDWTLALGDGLQDGGTVTLFTYGSLAGTPDLAPTFDISTLGFTPSSTLSLTDTGTSIVLNGVSVIPEPASAALVAAGVTLLGLRRRKPVA